MAGCRAIILPPPPGIGPIADVSAERCPSHDSVTSQEAETIDVPGCVRAAANAIDRASTCKQRGDPSASQQGWRTVDARPLKGYCSPRVRALAQVLGADLCDSRKARFTDTRSTPLTADAPADRSLARNSAASQHRFGHTEEEKGDAATTGLSAWPQLPASYPSTATTQSDTTQDEDEQPMVGSMTLAWLDKIEDEEGDAAATAPVSDEAFAQPMLGSRVMTLAWLNKMEDEEGDTAATAALTDEAFPKADYFMNCPLDGWQHPEQPPAPAITTARSAHLCHCACAAVASSAASAASERLCLWSEDPEDDMWI